MRTRFVGVIGFLSAVVLTSPVSAFPNYLTAWQAKCPTSTLPGRMGTATGVACNLCHHPPDRSVPGNCYRQDIINLLDSGLSIVDALDQLDSEDSDGDGVSNGEEITAPYLGSPGEVGYNPGLIGATGTDPCADDPGEVVTGQWETPLTNVPTVSEWGLVALTLLLTTAGTILVSRRRMTVATSRPRTR